MADEKKDDENIGSFYMGRMRPRPEPKRLLPPGALTLIALAALGGIIWYAYPRGAEKYTNVDVPLVKADTAPIKAAPANPGGMEVRHQDSTVFDPLQKNPGAEVEKLAPTPEEPMDREQAIKDLEAKLPVVAPSTVPPPLNPPVKDANNGAEKIMPKAEDVSPPPVAVPPQPAVVKIASAAPPPEAEVKKEQPQEDDATDEATDKPAAAPAASGAKYEVQLGSYRETADAKKDWDRFQKKYAGYLGKLKMRLVKADIPGKGTYYRLRAGTISKDRAHEICDALKSDHGVGCILAKE
jgi:hypothetical protein